MIKNEACNDCEKTNGLCRECCLESLDFGKPNLHSKASRSVFLRSLILNSKKYCHGDKDRICHLGCSAYIPDVLDDRAIAHCVKYRHDIFDIIRVVDERS
jgi:hypothetical protein